MTKEEIKQIVSQLFGDHAEEAYLTLNGENGGWNPIVPDNKNNDGTLDRGLFQINSNTFNDFFSRKNKLLKANGINSYEDMYDPVKNALMARIIYNEQGWNAWYGSPVEQRQGRPNEELLLNKPIKLAEHSSTINIPQEFITKEKQIQPIAYPTPVYTPATTQEEKDKLGFDVRSRDRMISKNIQKGTMEMAKEIQAEYNKSLQNVVPWARPLVKIFNPQPIFGAENNSSQIEDINMGFLQNTKKTQGYGEKTFSFYGKNGHEGNDFRASVGTPVRGFQGWVVDFAGQGESYYGNKVVLRNPNTGEAVEFAHLKDIGVQKGQTIGKDQIIATTGNSGYRPDGQSQQAHLHVNYYTPDNKRGDISKVAKQTENNFSMVPSFDSVINKAKQITQNLVKPKPVMATEETTPTIKPTATDQKLKETPLEDRNIGTRVIKPGETLSALAKQYNVTVNDFMRQNPQITNPNIIRANEVIKVPVKTDVKTDGYTIKPGDTLSAIARNLGTTVNDLVRKNNIQNPNLIRAGERIKA